MNMYVLLSSKRLSIYPSLLLARKFTIHFHLLFAVMFCCRSHCVEKRSRAEGDPLFHFSSRTNFSIIHVKGHVCIIIKAKELKESM